MDMIADDGFKYPIDIFPSIASVFSYRHCYKYFPPNDTYLTKKELGKFNKDIKRTYFHSDK